MGSCSRLSWIELAKPTVDYGTNARCVVPSSFPVNVMDVQGRCELVQAVSNSEALHKVILL